MENFSYNSTGHKINCLKRFSAYSVIDFFQFILTKGFTFFTEIGNNRNNFPSKVLEYLSYGKPVVSTWTSGIAPEYASLLAVPTEESPDAFAQTLRDVLVWPRERRADHARAACAHLVGKKTWSYQALRLADFLCAIPRINVPT